ncbi:hypothetical protein CSB93_2717 [Pseudomonas paraeruginosa]|uniref:Uncharacterized protein n=1 Tax=Pseudomonas paraeruginosa TaxID=2994495 RepID=A0A2R3J0X9_9PSED|nr:hypothetical protein CSB93_2717 [Pseudomonas paraeruginosa]AWE91695.1 hypothetical protein CSC28_1488 [Pseudomonas paraeruginosa]
MAGSRENCSVSKKYIHKGMLSKREDERLSENRPSGFVFAANRTSCPRHASRGIEARAGLPGMA